MADGVDAAGQCGPSVWCTSRSGAMHQILSIFSYDWNLLKTLWEIPHESPHQETDIEYRKTQSQDRSIPEYLSDFTAHQIVLLPIKHETVVHDGNEPDSPSHRPSDYHIIHLPSVFVSIIEIMSLGHSEVSSEPSSSSNSSSSHSSSETLPPAASTLAIAFGLAASTVMFNAVLI